jgi:hypothetical protein
MGTGGFLPGVKALTAHLLLVPGFRMSGALHLLLLYASMTWTDATLPFTVQLKFRITRKQNEI